MTVWYVQLVTQVGDKENVAGSSDKELDEHSTTAQGVLTSKHSHMEEDMANGVSTMMQDTLTLDSAPAVVHDRGKDDRVTEDGVKEDDAVKGGEVMAELAAVNTGDTQANSNGDTEAEVCYYYDSRQYDKVLRETFRAVHGDMTDGGDVSTVSVTTPDLDQIINGHPLRMYKRTAKVVQKFILCEF